MQDDSCPELSWDVSWPKRKLLYFVVWKCVVLLVTNSTANLKHSKIVNQAPEITRLRGKGEFLETVCSWSSLFPVFWIFTVHCGHIFRFFPHPWGITSTLKNWDFLLITWLEEAGLCGNYWIQETLIIHSKGLTIMNKRKQKGLRKIILPVLVSWLTLLLKLKWG